MDILHAPWRIEYILAPKTQESTGSLFSDIGQSSNDLENHVLTRGKTCYAMLNTYPYNGGHLMVIPYRKVSTLPDLTDNEMLEIMQMTALCQKALTQVMSPDGFNIGLNLGKVAGAGIEQHLHLHVVPRWGGDTNFMPVISNTRVVPEALEEIAAKIRNAIQDIQSMKD